MDHFEGSKTKHELHQILESTATPVPPRATKAQLRYMIRTNHKNKALYAAYALDETALKRTMYAIIDLVPDKSLPRLTSILNDAMSD